MSSPPAPIGADEIQLHRVVSAMRLMLVTVSVSALVLVGVMVYLYGKTFPEIRTLKAAAEDQKQKNLEARARLADSCVKLATLQNASVHDFEGASKTLDACMIDFPQEPILPAYKAQVMTQWFQTDTSKPVRLEYALQAAGTSFAISRANGTPASEEAYQWKLLASCLQVRFGPADGQNAAKDRALSTFNDAVRVHPQLYNWAQSEVFQGACPQEVKSAVHL